MSILINDTLKNFVQTSFSKLEKEESNNKEIEVLLSSFRVKQKLTDTKTQKFNLPEDSRRNNAVKLLNKNFLKTYFNFLNLAKKKNHYNEFIQYIVHVSTLKNNTIIYVTNAKGQLKFFCSASFSLKLTGKQKTIQPKVLINLIKYLLNTANFFKNNISYNNKENLSIAIHSKHTNKNFLKLIILRLKKKVGLKTINFLNFYPHNGCRNKKVKRLKRRNKNRRTKKPFAYTNSNKKVSKLFIKPNLNLKIQYKW